MKNRYENRGKVTAVFINYKGKTYETLIDTEDLELVNNFPNTWKIKHDPKYKNQYYVLGQVKKGKKIEKYYSVHRLVMGEPANKVIDHINHNTLDNRKINLRAVTHQENMQNRTVQSNNKTGYPGVYWYEPTKRWLARIKVKGQVVHFGYFKEKDDAIQAVREGRMKYQPFRTLL